MGNEAEAAAGADALLFFVHAVQYRYDPRSMPNSLLPVALCGLGVVIYRQYNCPDARTGVMSANCFWNGLGSLSVSGRCLIKMLC